MTRTEILQALDTLWSDLHKARVAFLEHDDRELGERLRRIHKGTEHLLSQRDTECRQEKRS